MRGAAYYVPAFLTGFTPVVAGPLSKGQWPDGPTVALGALAGLGAGAVAVKALFDPTATDNIKAQ